MKLRYRYRKLSFWNKIAFWGACASVLAFIAGFFFWVFPSPFQWNINQSPPKPSEEPPEEEYRIDINSVEVSARDPIWGYESFDEDEIVVKVSGTATIPSSTSQNSIVAFWRLANDYVTNWHVGRRRDGGNYKLAVLESSVACSGQWDFLIGGIECKKDYSGDIMIVLLLYPKKVIDEHSYSWRRDSGWGFRELPAGYIAVSPTRVFKTTSNR